MRRCVSQGPYRAVTAIRKGLDLLPAGVRRHHRCLPPDTAVVLAEEAPERLEQVPEHAGHPERDHVHPARDGYQLLVVDSRRVHLPVLDPETPPCVVGEV